ncbi:MAG: hypothetical protein MI824_26755 [Hyphomicrobiales bacterium]|nr:hypothetical protein [Hyphomicrobiales bacterium]
MAHRLYHHKLKKCVPLLTEAEFKSITPHLQSYLNEMRKYKRTRGWPAEAARAYQDAGEKAMDAYEEIAGERLDHPEQLFTVRLAHFGRLCPECGKPFRTPHAKLCAECGYALPDGEVAGPISET